MKKLFSLTVLFLISVTGLTAQAGSRYNSDTPREVLRIYTKGKDGELVYTYRNENYSNLDDFPYKSRIKKVVVKVQASENDRKKLKQKINAALGENVIVIFTYNKSGKDNSFFRNDKR